MLRIAVDSRSATAFLDRLAAFGVQQGKVMRLVSRGMEQQARQAFRDQVDPWGKPWPPLAPSTLKARAGRRASNVNRRASQQPLVDTGAMFGSLRSTATADSAAVEIGDGLPDVRATVHQYGGGRVPARPFFPIRPGGNPDPAPAWWAVVLRPIDDAINKVIA